MVALFYRVHPLLVISSTTN